MSDNFNKLRVLDHGYVELLDSMGSDLAIVQAAQASFDRSSEEFGEREQGILRFLMREEHGVPFEHVVFKYRLCLPVFVARQFVKHRVSSWSEHSARYSELEPLFYVPLPWLVRSQVGKPGAYTFEPVEPGDASAFLVSLADANDAAWKTYQSAIDSGIAKELARLSLPQNIYTTVVWTINARSLFNVLRLRADDHAQYETRQYAEAMEDLAWKVIPHTMRAFNDSGKPKP